MIDFLTACACTFFFLLIVSRWSNARVNFLNEARQHPRAVLLTCLAAIALYPLDMQDIWSLFIPPP